MADGPCKNDIYSCLQMYEGAVLEMNKDLENYVLKIPNILDDAFCKKIIKELQSAHWEINTFYNHKNKKISSVSGAQELDTSYTKIKSNDVIIKKLWLAIHKYIVEFLKFKWFDSWEGYSPLRFNRYSKNQLMMEHCDHIKSLFTGENRGIPVLSLVGLLNNNYTGGEFIMFQDKEYKIKAGEVLLFPSNFLYPHKVLPVKKGIRYSYTSWVF